MATYDACSLYSDAYNIEYKWSKWLPKEVYRYHELFWKECSSPVDLQMGVMLPFIASLCGPTTKSLFSTRKSCINLYWVNIAASGVGKTQSLQRFISEPMSFMLENTDESFEDFTVNGFTRAGIQDKLISTGGYCCIVTDEGSNFFDDLKKKETKHESDLGMLNQLYDGNGDKTTLAQSRERIVPKNSTCLSVSLQPEPFISGLQNLGSSLWKYNGFGERFLISAVKPYRFISKINNEAGRILQRNYEEDFIGKVCLEIYNYHKDMSRCYCLSDEAQALFEEIADKYTAQFNLKYSTEPISASQPKLDQLEKAEITVRTKAKELIGRLSTVVWIYCNAFQCVKNSRPVNIPLEISKDFVKHAEEIVSISYAQSETFSSAVLSRWQPSGSSLAKPKMTDRSRVIAAIARSCGPVAYIRLLAKNLRNMTTEVVRDELSKICDEGYGRIVTKDEMHKDSILPYKLCSNVYMKPDISTLDQSFFKMCQDPDVSDTMYTANFNKAVDDNTKKIVIKYHPHRHIMPISQMSSGQSVKMTDGNISFVQALPNKSSKVFVIGKGMVSQDKVNFDHLTSDSKGQSTVLKERFYNPSSPELISEYEEKGLFKATSKQEDDNTLSSASEDYENRPLKVTVPVYKGHITTYKRSKTGGKLLVDKRVLTDIDVTHVSDTDDNTTCKAKQKVYKKKSSKLTLVESLNSTDDSDIEVKSSGNIPEGKTSRWNREKYVPRYVKDAKQEPIRKSERIKELKDRAEKEKKSESNSSDIIMPSQKKGTRSKKRRLSKSQRDEIYSSSKRGRR